MKKAVVILAILGILFAFAGCSDDQIDEATGILDGVSDYLQSDEFQEESEKWADEINSLLE